MSKQKITYPDYGSRSMRVLEALTPLTGAAAPAVHADFIGQIYVEITTPALYVAVATDSDDAANDWALSTIAAVPAAVAAAILQANIPGEIALAAAEFEPLKGAVAPAAHADFIGQIYVDTVTGKRYMAIATDSAEAADDWKELISAEFEPLTGIVSPGTHADFIGQIYVDTVTGKGYMAIATDSAAEADDWKELTFANEG